MVQNGNPNPTGPANPGLQVHVLGQYIKDLSFESPNIGKLLGGAPENPNLNVEVNVARADLGNNVHESSIIFSAKATAKTGTIYELEIEYAGAFRFENAPPQALEPMLLANCPALIFPFLRRIVADLTREGGFPPLLLDPIDFAALYLRKKSEGTGQPPAGPSA